MSVINKPPSMSVREWLIKSVGARENIPQATIAKIVDHQYQQAYKALKDNNSIEIAGFGKFYYNATKAEKIMAKNLSQKAAYKEVLNEPGITEKKRHTYERWLANVESNIHALESKNLI